MPADLFMVELLDAPEPDAPALPARTMPLPGEALGSWLLRYAAPFGIAPETLLFGDREAELTADVEWWRKPDPLVIAAIARGTGVAADRIRSLTLLDWRGPGRDDAVPERFGRQRFTAASPSQQTRRIGICPECLAEDDIPHIRRDWMVGWVGACARHRAILVRICPECGAKLRLPSLGSSAHFAPERCTRCAFQLARAPYRPAPEPMVRLQQQLLDDRPNGVIALPDMIALDWPMVVALFDAMLGIVWFDTKPRAREQLFARIESDFDCQPFGSASEGADGLSILAWMLDAWPRHTQLAFAVLRASRPRRQMRRWPHLAEHERAEVEAVLLGAWPDQKHSPDRGWWRAWIETLPETAADLRTMAKLERLPHRRQRLLALADVRDGLPVEVAAEAAGVMARTLYIWLRRGAKDGLDAALERPRWQYLTEPQARELIDWIAATSPHGPRWRCNRVVSEARSRFGVEITAHVAQAMLRRHGPWPKRMRRPKRRLTVAPVYD